MSSEGLDIRITNARLRGKPGYTFVIGIHQGRIESIEEATSRRARVEIDARGNLVTESFCNPHLHLDKVYTLARLDDQAMRHYHGESMSAAMKAIESASRVKEQYEKGWILENARKAIMLAAHNGNTHIRAFADVDTKARLEGIKALIGARSEFRGVVDLQIVAFPQDGVIREPGAADLVREAMDLGADLVGGIPWIEYTDKAAQEHIDTMFAIAREFDAGISMLVDDAGDPGLRTLEMLAIKTIEEGWQGRVLAHHARAMAFYPGPYLQKLVALLRAARIGLAIAPHTGPLHARVRELHNAGVLVALGQDDISDAYYPFGQNNMLEIAFLASHLLWMTSVQDMELLYDMISIQAARAMGLDAFGLHVGSPAHLVVLDAPDIREAFRTHQSPLAVISHGKLISGGE